LPLEVFETLPRGDENDVIEGHTVLFLHAGSNEGLEFARERRSVDFSPRAGDWVDFHQSHDQIVFPGTLGDAESCDAFESDTGIEFADGGFDMMKVMSMSCPEHETLDATCDE